jgi:hypothetical protein
VFAIATDKAVISMARSSEKERGRLNGDVLYFPLYFTTSV